MSTIINKLERVINASEINVRTEEETGGKEGEVKPTVKRPVIHTVNRTDTE